MVMSYSLRHTVLIISFLQNLGKNNIHKTTLRTTNMLSFPKFCKNKIIDIDVTIRFDNLGEAHSKDLGVNLQQLAYNAACIYGSASFKD